MAHKDTIIVLKCEKKIFATQPKFLLISVNPSHNFFATEPKLSLEQK